jgi:thiamine biosynthesis lipoprotein
MNTIIRIQVTSSKGTVFTQEKIQHAFSFFDHVINHFSRFKPDSELSKLNRGKLKDTPISKELFDLIELALDAANITDGIYDPTVIDLLEAYGYDEKNSFANLKDKGLNEQIKKIIQNRPSFKEIELDKSNRTVKLKRGQRIDMGSIAKGYAVDLALEYLASFKFEGVLVNAGGDIRAQGVSPKHLPWSIALFKAPLPNKEIEVNSGAWGNIDLLNESISGSGGWARKVGIFHHLINPKTGFPQNEISQDFVVAPSAKESDLWATVLFLLGKSGLAQIHNKGYKGMVVDFTGAIFKSSNFMYY